MELSWLQYTKQHTQDPNHFLHQKSLVKYLRYHQMKSFFKKNENTE